MTQQVQPLHRRHIPVTEPDVWKWGYMKNQTYQRPFMSAVHTSLAGNLRALPPPEKKIKFPAVLRGLPALFSLFLVDILSRSQFPHPILTISTQIWTNYGTHIFKKWGYVPPDPPWLRQWNILMTESNNNIDTGHSLAHHHHWQVVTCHISFPPSSEVDHLGKRWGTLTDACMQSRPGNNRFDQTFCYNIAQLKLCCPSQLVNAQWNTLS